MSKLLKIFIIFMITINLFFYTVNAETTNLYNDVSEEEISEEAENTTPSSTSSGINSSARISTLSSIPEANLGLNNVLCIILIAIGVLIILLAIAILIRLK